MIAKEDFSILFRIALLLTGDAERAEAAIVDGIEHLNCDQPSKRALLVETIRAAIAFPGNPFDAPHGLPIELARLFRLPEILRRCFVMSVLARLPRGICSLLLGIEPEDVDDNTRSAALALAAFIPHYPVWELGPQLQQPA